MRKWGSLVFSGALVFSHSILAVANDQANDQTSNQTKSRLGADEWFISFTAEASAANLSSQRGFLGQLQTARDTYDHNDLETLAPIDANFLYVAFSHHDWRQRPGAYAGDFRETGGANEWTFEVSSSDADRNVTLKWDATRAGDQSMFMYLVDIDSNMRIPVQAASEYQFNMNGNSTRTFIWQYSGSSYGRLGAY